MIVEALAQTAAVLMMYKQPPPGRFPFFAGIDKEGFRRPVVVGDALYLEVSVLQQRSESCKLQGTATVGDEIAAQSQILAVLRSSH
jgi:3-hydroxymyristoyl/3-hydroxydecanoyl-(acyl carrier protein) dehydratase